MLYVYSVGTDIGVVVGPAGVSVSVTGQIVVDKATVFVVTEPTGQSVT